MTLTEPFRKLRVPNFLHKKENVLSAAGKADGNTERDPEAESG